MKLSKILIFVVLLFGPCLMVLGGIAIIVHGWQELGLLGMALGGMGLAIALLLTAAFAAELIRIKPISRDNGDA